MIWKPKEKQLTKDEAIALAKEELAPYWQGSRPLITAVKSSLGKTSAHVLDDEFFENSWILFFVDIVDTYGEGAVQLANEFFARYVPNRVKAILIARPIYQYLLDKERLEQISRRHQISYPITVDYNGLMAAAFGVQDFPAVRLVSQEGVMIQRDGPKWMDGFESQLQLFLRKADPGLPLLPLLEFSGKAPREVLRIELGKDPITQSANPEKSLLVPEPPEDLEPGFFYFTGRWEQDGEKVVTTDEHAQVVFRSPASIVNLVGQSLGVTYEAGKIVVEIEDSNALDVFGGQDLEFDDEGRSVIRVSTPRIYHALINLPESTRRIRLRFPNADIAKIALYGFRFCD